ncbi:PQQ-binding-like beta-propeller repeat protein [Halorubellus sp. JP-L1]|uniref:outer membrane protein assembly factor BamB family protein n=1 Tax=Halorubellus sp. JP-L1 TaxID=2715753 RepID=UPI0014090FFF|nr:PQQ-binding-like beta-propeller repeat protein [Halorubellus sp. JP-L1]NHN40489.1 PQQ-binding-like beta-propeller repeat protein [Halorubellus sp. JP-L1]
MPSTNRRRFLAAAAALGVAGCVTHGDGVPTGTETTHGSATSTGTRSRVTSENPTTSTTTYRTTGSDVDERVDAKPPGDPALPTDGGDWPQEGYDAARTGYWPDGDPVEGVDAYWTLDAGGEGAVVDDSVVNVHGRADGQPLTVRDPGTAEVRRASSLVEYGVNSSPAVADGVVVVTTFIEAFAYDLETGDLAWRGPEMDGIHGAPTVADGTVYVASGGYQGVPAQVRAFDLADGTERWRRELETTRTGSVAVGGGVAYVQSRDGLHAFDAESGNVVFERSDLRNGSWVDPVVGDDHAFTVDDDDLVAVDAGSGEEAWRVNDADFSGTPVLADGELYAGTDGDVGAYAAADGSEQRTFYGGKPLARVDDVLYVANDPRGRIQAVSVADGDDQMLWSYTTPEVQISDTINRTVYGITPLDGALWVHAADGVHGLAPPQ